MKKTLYSRRYDAITLGRMWPFKPKAKQEGLRLHFKFTAWQTLHQNSRVECKFATLFGRVRSMLNLARHVNKHVDLYQGLWAECTNTATKMENLAVRTSQDPPF